MDVMLQNDINWCQMGLWIITLAQSERTGPLPCLSVCLSLRKTEEEAGRSERAAAVSTDAHEKRFHSHVPLHLFVSW